MGHPALLSGRDGDHPQRLTGRSYKNIIFAGHTGVFRSQKRSPHARCRVRRATEMALTGFCFRTFSVSDDKNCQTEFIFDIKTNYFRLFCYQKTRGTNIAAFTSQLVRSSHQLF
jgi:hypothetical protein